MSTPRGYNNIRKDIVRWDNLLNKLRRDVIRLKRQGNLTVGNRVISTGISSGVEGSDAGNGFNNSYIGRIYLDTTTSFGTNESSTIISPENWSVDFEVGVSSSALLQSSHHFTVPSSLNDTSLVGKKVYVQVSFAFTYDSLIDLNIGDSLVQFSILKNGVTKVTSSFEGINDGSETSTYLIDYIKSITNQDIIQCDPGDTLDFYIETEAYKIPLFSDKTSTFATFTVLYAENAL